MQAKPLGKLRPQHLRVPFFTGLTALLLFFSAVVLPGWAQGPIGAKFRSTQGKDLASFSLEVVSTPPLRAQGLMFRRDLAVDSGMIFVFPGMAPRSFWMKDTYIPLDMIFLNDSLEVVSILANVPILNTQPRLSGVPAQYVVELKAGTAKSAGIVVGSKLIVSAPLPAASE